MSKSHDKYAINEEMASDYTEVPVNPCRSHSICRPRIMHRRGRKKKEKKKEEDDDDDDDNDEISSL